MFNVFDVNVRRRQREIFVRDSKLIGL